MEQISALLCALSLCGLLLCGILLILPLQPVSDALQPLAVEKAQPLCQLSAEQLDSLHFSSDETSFSLINQGSKFVIEGFENIVLQESKLQRLLDLLKNFPLGHAVPTQPSEPADLTLEITPVNGTDIILSFFRQENNFLVSNGRQTQQIPAEVLMPVLQSAEYYVDTSIIYKAFPSEGSLLITGDIHEEPLSLSFNYIGKNKEQLFAYLTEPDSQEISPKAMETILQSLCDLEADSAAVLNPAAMDLKNTGLDSPFFILYGNLDGEKFYLSLSQPYDNSFYIRKNEDPVIYQISAEKLPWLTVCTESITEESIFFVDYEDCTTMTLTCQEKNIRFTKWDGQVLCNGKQIDETNFSDFFDFATELIPCGATLHGAIEESPVLSLTFSYTNPQKAADIVQFYPYSEQELLLSINGNRRFLCKKEKSEEIFHRCETLLG